MALHVSLPIYKVAYDLLSVATDLVRNMPRDYKASIGGKLREERIEMVILIFRANAARNKVDLDTLIEANSHFGLLRQATQNHADRALLANALRRRGHCVGRALTKTCRRGDERQDRHRMGGRQIQESADMMKWVTIAKLAELTGYSEKAIRRKIEEGMFCQGKHWRYSPDNRIHFNVEEYEKWVETQPTRASMRGKRRSSSASSGVASDSARPSTFPPLQPT